MAGRYSGNLVRTYAAPDDIKNPYPDARHQTRGHEEDGTDEYPERHRVPASTGEEFAGSQFPDDVTQAPGVLLDDPSWANHDGPAILWPVYSDDQYREQLPGAHGAGADRGHIRAQYAAPPVQSQRELYGELVDEGNLIPVNPNTEGSPALMRGINAYPLNNPERDGYVRGVRPGQFRRLVPDRWRLMHRRAGRYDLQPLTERSGDLNVPVNAPAPGGDGASPPYYGPVLSTWLPTWVGRREVEPALWRDPGKVDDSLLAASPATGGYDVTIGGEL